MITKQDLLLTNTQTRSNNNWLISGGAFKIDIKANGESLILQTGKKIHVKFPKHTSKDNMQIFYGKRDKAHNMKWEPSKIKLEDEVYYTISYKNSSVLDTVLSKQFRLDMYKQIILVDTLGYLKYKHLVGYFPEIDKIVTDNDTLRIYDTISLARYLNDEAEIDNLVKISGVSKQKYIFISRVEAENLTKYGVYMLENEAEAFYKSKEATNQFYKSIEISKLGWINIDKFVAYEEKVKIKLSFNKNTIHNEVYIIDERNNTVLNIHNYEVELPVNRSLYLIAIGIRGKDIYSFKKSVRFNKNTHFEIPYKKTTEKQLKSILTLSDN